jgi:WD40 repeat protein
MVASCSEDSTIRIWDVVTGACLHVLTDAEIKDTILFATAWSPDSNHLAVASYREGVRVYDMNTEAFRRLSHSVPSRSRRVEWSPNGRYLAGAGEGDTISIWNTDDFSLRATCRDIRMVEPRLDCTTARGLLRAVGDTGVTNC